MTTAISYEVDTNNIVTLTMDMPNQSANTMNADYRAAMKNVVDKLEQNKDKIAGVILTSAKSTFFAGGDLNEIIKIDQKNAAEFFDIIQDTKKQMRRLETLGKPVVAAINGTALGGGFELALSCHHRICLNNPKTQLGLPEVSLGLLPGGGGVVRMVRILGLQNALPYLTEGKQIKPASALEAGLIHEIAESSNELLEKSKAWILKNPTAKQPWDTKDYKIPGGTPNHPKVAQLAAIAPAMTIKKTKGCYPAPEAILAAAIEGAQVDFDSACTIESRYFLELATGKVAKNMISTFWFQLNEIKGGDSRPDDIAPSKTKKLGIIGAGMMGAGIAFTTASKGINVVLKDISQEAADKGKAHAEVLLSKKVKRGKMTQEKANGILELIQPTTDAADFDGCDLVIEAVFENRDLKEKVTKEIEPFLAPNAVIASNTSTLPITGLAKAVKKPNDFIGLHFFSPVEKMQLVEIIKGKDTSAETLARAFDYVLQIGKTPIVVNDSPGFFTSRVFMNFINEGIALLGEGIYPWTIERAATDAGMPVGPLAITDEISLRLGKEILDQQYADLKSQGKEIKEHPAYAVLSRMLSEFNRPGKVAGSGFYDYPNGQPKKLWPELAEHYVKADAQIDYSDIKERLLFIQVIEAVRCLEEGVIESIADTNIGSVFGFGFAPWAGGVIQLINDYGIDAFANRANELAGRYGERFTAPKILVKQVGKNQPFTLDK
jgi:3-hydroxyacyl-CoA dehydrogenase/enoyl-CoA hydratase/3-hydroxybutyryl-CoA epimerase